MQTNIVSISCSINCTSQYQILYDLYNYNITQQIFKYTFCDYHTTYLTLIQEQTQILLKFEIKKCYNTIVARPASETAALIAQLKIIKCNNSNCQQIYKYRKLKKIKQWYNLQCEKAKNMIAANY